MRILTAKMDKFAQLVFAGRTLSQAYRESYATQGTARTIAVEASRLAAHPLVIRRIEELRLVASAPAVVEHFEKRRKLALIARTSFKPRDVIRAIRKDLVLIGELQRRRGMTR